MYLGEESIITLPRLQRTETFETYASGIYYAQFDGIENVAFRLTNGPSTKLLPQLHIMENSSNGIDTTFIGAEGDFAPFAAAIQRQIDRNFKDTKSEINPEVQTLAVINHRGKDLWLRAPDKAHVEKLKNLLRDNLQELMAPNLVREAITSPSPTVRGRLKVDFHLMDRAVSKIAFNMMARVYGPEVVLHPSFDGARRFIRYGEENDAVRVGLLKQDDLVIPSVAGAEHEVMFFPMVGSTAIVNLYNAFRFLVSFPEGQLPSSTEAFSSWTFSGQRDNTFDEQGAQTLADILNRMGALE